MREPRRPDPADFFTGVEDDSEEQELFQEAVDDYERRMDDYYREADFRYDQMREERCV